MTLTDLLTMQRELQTHSDTQPETLDQIRIAQVAELGEIEAAYKAAYDKNVARWRS
jgi:hypothetical protein